MNLNLSRVRSLAKNTLILSLGTCFPKIMSFITLPLLTGHLTKAEYGKYDLITVLVIFLLPAVTLQIHTGAFRYLIEYRDDKEKAEQIITNTLLYTTSVSLLCLIIAGVVLRDGKGFLPVLIYLFFDMYLIVVQQLARGTGKNMLYSTSAIIHSAVYMVLTVLLVGGLRQGLTGAIIALLGGVFAAGLYLTVRLRLFYSFKLRLVSGEVIKTLLAYSWPIVPNSLCNWVLNLSDRLIAAAFLGIESGAVLAIAHKLPNLLVIFQSSFLYAWQESASLTVQDDDASQYYESMFKGVTNLLAGGLSFLIGISPAVFGLLVRGDYGGAYPQTAVLYLAIFYSCLSSFLAGIYVANMKTVNIGITTIAAALCSLTLNLVLINKIGLYAASISALVSYLLLAVYRMINIQSFQKIKFDIRVLIFDTAVLCGMVFIFIRNTFVGNVVNFMLGTAAAVFLNRDMIAGIKERLPEMTARSNRAG